MRDPLLKVDDLTIQYETDQEPITAVSNATFSVYPNEFFGLLGESGCGKSTIAKSLVGDLDANGRIHSGTIQFNGREIQNLSESKLNEDIRWKRISYIPQASMESLDPLRTIKAQAIEVAKVHKMPKAEALDNLANLFEIMGLSPERITNYPHQFSGGMKQRAIIAFALLLNPSIVIADEPTTALDVIMQDQVFKYLDSLKETSTALFLITHDMSLIFESCERAAVMHAGQIAEIGTTQQIYRDARHPYTILLQEAFPDHRKPDMELKTIDGHPPRLEGAVNYCTFCNRCPWEVDECSRHAPELVPKNETSTEQAHQVACFRKDEVRALYEAND